MHYLLIFEKKIYEFKFVSTIELSIIETSLKILFRLWSRILGQNRIQEKFCPEKNYHQIRFLKNQIFAKKKTGSGRPVHIMDTWDHHKVSLWGYLNEEFQKMQKTG